MMVNRRQAGLALALGSVAAAMLARKPRAETLPPLALGLRLVTPPATPPDSPFVGADGATHHLADFKGHGMVVNLWATWCVPCVSEIPSLAALSKALAPKDIAVLPLSSDRGGADTVRTWYQKHDITDLPVLLDPTGAMVHALNAPGIPTTIIIDAKGLIVARLEGAADWASPEAQAVVRKLAGT